MRLEYLVVEEIMQIRGFYVKCVSYVLNHLPPSTLMLGGEDMFDSD